jgi:hypothetical protein
VRRSKMIREYELLGSAILALSAPTAALIGAGVAAAVGLVAQYLAHQLSLRRERAAHQRERLSRVVEEAALALHRDAQDRDAEPGPPGTLAGRLLPWYQFSIVPHVVSPYYTFTSA